MMLEMNVFLGMTKDVDPRTFPMSVNHVALRAFVRKRNFC